MKKTARSPGDQSPGKYLFSRIRATVESSRARRRRRPVLAVERGEYLADIIDACYGDIPLYRGEGKARSYERKIESFPAGGFAVYCIDSMHPRCILGMSLPWIIPAANPTPYFPSNSTPLSLFKQDFPFFPFLSCWKMDRRRWSLFKQWKGKTIMNNGGGNSIWNFVFSICESKKQKG